jgi:hypothetical protein
MENLQRQVLPTLRGMRRMHRMGIISLFFSNTADQGINLLFGESQHYGFTLKYHLSNPSISQGVSQIALPPDTNYQKIVYTSIDPKPDAVEQDEDGNWIATYTLGGQKDVLVTAEGTASVYLKPAVTIGTAVATQQELKAATEDQPFWERNDAQILALARELKTPRAIYDYLVRSYSYDYARLSLADQRRRGAVAALQAPTNVLCQEFTDTFIAIARAAGISAREVNGYAYTENTRLRPTTLTNDLLHAWPEYYDTTNRRWIPIDPTWGNTTGGVDFFTKLDFNHIAFVIHGASSEKPYSAGMYKLTGQEGKDVEVQLAPLASIPLQKLTLAEPSFLQPNTVRVKNESGAAWYDVPIRISTTSNLSLSGKQQKTITLVPYEEKELEIHVDSANILSSLTRQKGTVTVTIGDETTHYETTVGSISPTAAVGVGFVICTILAGCVLVFRRKR